MTDWKPVVSHVQNGSSDEQPLVPSSQTHQYLTLTLTTSKRIQIPLSVANVILSILNVIAQVGMTESLSIYSTSLSTHQACGKAQTITGPYFVLFFTAFWFPVVFFACVLLAKLLNRGFSLHLSCSQKRVALMGLFNALNGVLIVYSSPSSRTPVFLQPILSTSLIPFTVILRFILLRKGLSKGRLICTFAVLVGLFICIEPSIFGLGGNSQSSKNRTATKIYWPILFCLGFLPLGFMNVLQEREVKTDKAGGVTTIKNEVNSLLFQAWIQLYNFIFLAALFWTAFIPHFGINDSWSDFSQHMRWGFHCHFGEAPTYNCTISGNGLGMDKVPDPHCQIPIGRCWIFVIFYCLSYLIGLMLIKYAEGAVYLVIVNALITPFGTFFNTLFQLNPNNGNFYWGPSVDVDFYYALAGITLLVPAVIGYHYLGQKETQQRQCGRLDFEDQPMGLHNAQTSVS
jgi:drug/metabolite transporter (DMT)-like permease